MTGTDLPALTPLILAALLPVALMLVCAFARIHSLTLWVYELGLLAVLLAFSLPFAAPELALVSLDGAYSYFGPVFAITAMVLGVLFRQYGLRRNRLAGIEEGYVLLATAALGALVLAAASHYVTLFLGIELLGISGIALAAYPSGQTRALDPGQQRSLEAGIKYLLLSAAASALLLFGIALLYLQTGTLAFPAPGANGEDEAIALLGVGLFLAGVAFKLSLVPFHLWTPDVYQGAPTPVTALIATLSKGALIAVLLRFFDTGSVAPGAFTALSVLAVLSMLVGNLLALRQDNIKRLMAYSSIAHMGYLLVGLVAILGLAGERSALAMQAGAFYIAAYFTTTLAAFSIISSLSDGGGTPGDYRIDRYRGLLWRSPGVGACFSLVLLSLAGIPITAGFVGKFYLFAAGTHAGLWLLLGTLVVGSAIGLYYYLRIILVLLQPDEGVVPAAAGWREHWLHFGLTILLVLLGLYPEPLVAWLVAL